MLRWGILECDSEGNPSITAQCHTSHDTKLQKPKQPKAIYGMSSSDVVLVLYFSVGQKSIIISFVVEKAAYM